MLYPAGWNLKREDNGWSVMRSEAVIRRSRAGQDICRGSVGVGGAVEMVGVEG